MNETPHAITNVPVLTVNLSEIPALLDSNGVRKHLAPLGRTLLYELATRGEIQTASIGMKRGKRVFVTASVVQWLQRRMAGTVRPNIAPRSKESVSTRESSLAHIPIRRVGRVSQMRRRRNARYQRRSEAEDNRQRSARS